MSGDSLTEWFRCPFCGDDGDVIQAQVGKSSNLEFKCTSREHQLENGRFQSYRRNEWRRDTDTSILGSIWRKLTPAHTRKRITKLKPALVCPKCGSERTDGALERLTIGELRYERELRGITTVWCEDCGEVARSWIRADYGQLDPSKIEEKSEFPPAHV